MIIKVTTGETLGFQLVSPAGAAPVPFSVPYDPTSVDPNADYVARGSMWDGTTLWAMDSGVPVITKDNARSGVVLTVTEAVVPGASPSAAPVATPAPAPLPPEQDNRFNGFAIFVVIGLGVLALVGVLAYPALAPDVGPGQGQGRGPRPGAGSPDPCHIRSI